MNQACFQALALSLAGMVALSLAMDRHFEQFTQRFLLSFAMRNALRAAGVLLLGAAMWICIVALGTMVGFVAWWGGLSAGALLAVLTLSYQPQWVATVGLVSGTAALVSALGA
ncbi:DUF3325 domain-containing protein [Pigmentiphaga aceris]|nr:DUF3325 domain-containing protein [Pigmentiphaga aceris]